MQKSCLQHTRYILVNIEDTVSGDQPIIRQVDWRKIDCCEGASWIDDLDNLISHFTTNGILSLFGGASNVRCKNHIWEALQIGNPIASIYFRLNRVDIDVGPTKVAWLQSSFQSCEMTIKTWQRVTFQIHHWSSACVEQTSSLLHQRKLSFSNHSFCQICLWNMQCNKVTLLQKLIKGVDFPNGLSVNG